MIWIGLTPHEILFGAARAGRISSFVWRRNAIGVRMKMLALETSGQSGSLALSCDGRVELAKELDPTRRSAQTLAPAIRETMDEVGWRPNEIDVVALAIGPGSFTGLRVGVSTAKMFAWAIDARVVAVDTLDALAFRLKYAIARPCVASIALDAQRGDVAVREYWMTDDSPARLSESFRIESARSWLDPDRPFPFADNLASISNGETSAENRDALPSPIVTEKTSALFCYSQRESLKADLVNACGLTFVDSSLGSASALGVTDAAWRRVERDEYDDVFHLEPIYSRLAAAEERRASKRVDVP